MSVAIKSKDPIAAVPPAATHPLWLKLQQPGVVCALIVAAILLVYYPVGRFDFVNYDDPDYVSANPHVESGLSWKNVRWAFTSGHASNWHPITWLSHLLDNQLFGPTPGPQHLVSVAFHAINSLLLFFLLRRMTGAHWRSAFVAALFGLHPLRVESVAWISERKDVLSGFFLILTVFAYYRYVESSGNLKARFNSEGQGASPGRLSRRPVAHGQGGNAAVLPNPALSRSRWYWYGLALASLAFGLMSKPTLVVVPFWLLLLDYWPLERFCFEKADVRRVFSLFIEKTPFFVMAAGGCVITFLVQRSGGAVSSSLTISGRAANAVVSYVRYLGDTAWPHNLSVLYPHPGHWAIWKVTGACLVLGAIILIVILLARKAPYLPVGWFWFMGGLVPVIGLVQVGVQSMADRYTYLPSIGLLILIIWASCDAAEYWHLERPVLGTLAMTALLFCSVATRQQLRFWHDSIALFQRAIEVTSNNYLAYNNLGFDLSKKGRLQEAKEDYQKSLQINPRYPDALNNMGYALSGEKRYAEAVQYYEKALRFAPKQCEIHNNLGNALSELGKINEAIEQYGIALSIDPEHADAHNNLGIALAMQGKLDDAIEHFRAAIDAKQGYAGAHSNLGNALAAQHKFAEAIREYQESLRLSPDDAQAHNNLGNALLEQGRLDECMQQYAQALRLNPDNPEAHFNLAIALLKAKRPSEAAEHLKQTLQLNPAHAEARRQLQLLSGGK
jgi:tetratricopeptide (TPR) repeat protein